MLLQRLELLIPDWAAGPTGSLALVGWVWWFCLFAIGGIAWGVGARFSRGLVTLALVLVGSLAGKAGVTTLGLRVDPMAGAIVGAAVAGLAGFVFHRWLLGICLGYLLALWAVLGVWVTATKPATWDWSGKFDSADAISQTLSAWQTALGTDTVQRMAAYGGLAFFVGAGLMVLLPKLATALCWTLLGTTLLVGGFIAWCAGTYGSPGGPPAGPLARVPTETTPQLILLGLIVLVGLLFQWITRARPSDKPTVVKVEGGAVVTA